MKIQSFIITLFVALMYSNSFGQFITNGSTIVYTTDNVGIATSNPDVKLHVIGDSRITGFLRVGGNTDGNVWKMGLTGSMITRNGNVILGAASTDKIGLGTPNPDVKLHVIGDSRISGFLSLGGNTDGASWKLGVTGNVITRNGKVVLGAATSDLIGLGTVNPDVKLHVIGDSRITGFLRVGGNTDGYSWKMGLTGNMIQRNGHVALAVASTDAVSIGSTQVATGHKLSVDGKIIAEELSVKLSNNWPDYVFNSEYQLRPLEQVAETIKKEGHLPGLPSAAEVEAKGSVELGEMQRLMLEKVEEITLYLIQQNERIKNLEYENAALKSSVKVYEAAQK